MFCLTIYLHSSDSCVLFCCLVSVLFRLQLSMVRPNRSQVFLCLNAPAHKIGFKTAKQDFSEQLL